GQLLADLFFGGAFPSRGSLPRLYTIHVVVIPLSILGVLSLHLLLVLKQKHSMPAMRRSSQSLGACWAYRCGRIMRCSQASSYFLCWADSRCWQRLFPCIRWPLTDLRPPKPQRSSRTGICCGSLAFSS